MGDLLNAIGRLGCSTGRMNDSCKATLLVEHQWQLLSTALVLLCLLDSLFDLRFSLQNWEPSFLFLLAGSRSCEVPLSRAVSIVGFDSCC